MSVVIHARVVEQLTRRAAYDAAQAKGQDRVLDASDKITEACSACHDKYREKTPRCLD